MKRWKLPLHRMHRACSTECLFALLLSLLVMNCGCTRNTKTKPQEMTVGEWTAALCEKTDLCIFESENEEERMRIAWQTLKDWNVLDEDWNGRQEDVLTREIEAYIIAGLYGEECSEKTLPVRDLSDTAYPMQVQIAVNLGIIDTENGYFYPKRNATKEEAAYHLQKTAEVLNQRIFKEECKFSDRVHRIEPIGINEKEKQAEVRAEDRCSSGELVCWSDRFDNVHLYEVIDVRKEGDHYLLQLQEPDFEKLEEYSIQGSFEADFSQAEIHTDYEMEDTGSVGGIQLLSVVKKQKTFRIRDYRITLSFDSSSLKADITRPLPQGGELFADVLLTGVHTDYRFRKKNGEDSSYFKVSCTTTESFGIRNSSYKNLYGDLSGLKPQEFLSSLSAIWKNHGIKASDEFELCTIDFPIPQVPSGTLTMALNVRFATNGKAEIHLVQKNLLGAETRNGHVRLIRNCDASKDAVIRASAEISAGIRFALKMLSRRVADLSVHSGAKATASTTLHVYDEEGQDTPVTVDAAPDAAEELAEGQPDVLVCSDIKAYMILDFSVNGSDSLLGKLGFGQSFSVLNASNAPLLSALSGHYENGMAVDVCTRKSRKRLPEAEQLQISDNLQIEDYALILCEGDTDAIEITSLPSGYTEADLKFTSSNEEIAVVNEKGIVTAAGAGNTEITIRTKDGRYRIQCSVLVSREA